MKILFYDCFTGISGDMNLGAMIDLGVEKDYLINELLKLHLEGYQIKITKGNRKGIEGTKVDVILTNENSKKQSHSHGHHHHRFSFSGLFSPKHSHDHVHNQQDHNHTHDENNERNYLNIKKMIRIQNSVIL